MKRPCLLALLLSMAAVAAPGASPPKHVDVFISGKDGYAGYRIPAIETAPDGSLLAFAEARKHNLSDPGGKGQEIDLVLKRSTDGGATWSPMKLIEHSGELWSSANPATVVDRRRGRVWVFYLRCKPGRGTHAARPGTDDVANLARYSDDNGATWSEPIDQTAIARDMADAQWRISVPGPGGAIQDRKGRLIVPMWRFAPWSVFAMFSDDHGRTWQRGASVPETKLPGTQGLDEDQLVELSDGRILLDARQHGGPHRWTATSSDGGRTWSAPRPGQPVTPVCCAIERYTLKSAGDDRDRILWTGPKGPGRNKLIVRTSYDEGRTFTHERLICDEPAAYSDLTVLKDKSVGVLWERGNYRFITFTRLDHEFLQDNEEAAADVGPQMQSLRESDWIDSDRRFAAANTGPGRPLKINAQGVTTVEDASGAVDGIKNGRFGFHVAVAEKDPWWQVDLGEDCRLDRVVIYNRTDEGHAPRTCNIGVQVAGDRQRERFASVYRHDGTVFYGVKENKPLVVSFKDKNVTARFVRLFVPGTCHLALDEVEVYAVDDPKRNIALGKPADQKSVSRHSVAGAASTVAAPTDGGFLLAHTREIVRRGHRLAARLRPGVDPAELGPLATDLKQLDQRLAELERAEAVPKNVRKEVYFDARRLVRRVAFSNPLLALDKILFIKRHHPNYPHICDQYYGFTSIAGGGLFVLEDALSDHPKLTNLLAGSRVENGRFRGQALTPGSFLSPELSYDGTTVLFAYTRNADPETSPAQAEKGRAWKTTNCYHVFKVRADGSQLVQLTDGPFNDFDPCFLPGGRIAFVSERRGGYVRCGTRACRSYNLCSMEPDGSDIVALSRHDTNEWHPSVNNHGMIVYTRWDYIDRDTQAAHHLWTCYPDGRDPRAPHGNYPRRLADRPWAELDIRAIPGSEKYIAVAAPHHGHAFGSLIEIDLRIKDDNANSQIVRLTPEVPFPEGEAPIRPSLIYGTPWPLGEDDYLCVYDRNAKNHGIYWVDRFGNRELIYRDPAIPCFSPIPLRPRPAAPVILDYTTQTAAARKADDGDRLATIAVMNIYDSDFAWPDDVRITSLRVLQILPKSVPSRNTPKIGVAEQSNARAVLGNVPVQSDGSVFFEAPVDKLIYFQALDDRGMAVQSMRSATYVHAGEQLTCQGCHEPKHRAPNVSARPPLALRSPPAKIVPEVEGSNPFNFVRLVQPVLDRHCVDCHRREKAIDLSGTLQYVRDRDGRDWPYTRSYHNLAQQYGFWFQTLVHSLNTAGVHGGSRVIPGKFGARAARLLDYLDEKHHGVKLSEEDLHRMVLWLDCNSEFLGAYENAEAQARGEVVTPRLE